MIRGAIENVTTSVVKGWIHTTHLDVKELILLAFVDGLCVGSGVVSEFRKDLAEAGLGDGFLGYAIPVHIAEDQTSAVVVKPDGCDAVLMQQNARVSGAGSGMRRMKRAEVARQLASIKWALKRGRISQADFDFLRMIWSLGVYERGLVRRVPGMDTLVVDPLEGAVKSLFEAYAGQDVEVETVKVWELGDFRRQLARAATDPDLVPLVAVSTAQDALIRVLDGSHVLGNTIPTDPQGAPVFTEYRISPENFMLLETRVEAEPVFLPEVATELNISFAHLAR